MDFNDALAKEISHLGPACSVRLWREGLSKSNREQFDAALKSASPTAVIHRAMKALGYKHGDGSVARHRRGECSCDDVQ